MARVLPAPVGFPCGLLSNSCPDPEVTHATRTARGLADVVEAEAGRDVHAPHSPQVLSVPRADHLTG